MVPEGRKVTPRRSGHGPHVLVARLDNAGDVLLSGPAVRAVAADAQRLTYLCGPQGLEAAAMLPGVDEVVCHRAGWIDPEPRPVTREEVTHLVERLSGMDLDEAVVLTSFHQSPLPLALLLRLAGVARVGAISVDYAGSLLDVRHLVNDDVHEVERALSLVAALGHRLPEGDDARLAVRCARPQLGGDGYVVVHPGASVPARAWSPARMCELVEALADGGRSVVVTGSARERPLTALVARGAATDLGGSTDLGELASVLAGADVAVVGNTGPAHLAAAVGTAVVSIYAPTVPALRGRPWGVPHILLGDQGITCAGCRARRCPVPSHPCVEGIDTGEVLSAVEALAPRREPRPSLGAPV